MYHVSYQDSSFSLLLIFTISFVAMITIDLHEQGTVNANIFIRICLLLPLVYSHYRFYVTNPGIASHSLPIINQLELIRFKNFCEKCKCMQNESIKHCQYCDVCIQSSFVHSNILKTCISSKNVGNYCLLWVSIFSQSILYILS